MGTLPALSFNEERAVDRIAAQIENNWSRMNNSHENLARMLRDALRRGDWSITLKAIEAAERADDLLADTVLRATCAEMDNRHEPMSAQLRAFAQRAWVRPQVARGKGRDQYADWSRNVGICVLIEWACREFPGLRPTRSGAGRRQRVPSGCSLVKRALERHKIYLEENTIQRHVWLGLPGMLVRHAAAELEASSRFPQTFQ